MLDRTKYCDMNCEDLEKVEFGYFCKKYQVPLVYWVYFAISNCKFYKFHKCISDGRIKQVIQRIRNIIIYS